VNLGHIALSATIGVWFQTRNSSDVPTASDAAPTFAVYKLGTDTPLLSAQTTSAVSGATGFYRGSIAATEANGFEAGQSYCVRGAWAMSSSNRAEVLYFTVV
jgi:hypothetical protein